ncbi:hypothetical protein HDU83_003960 [Entophlyctis luteolus]|nr:hypothetical protein HDU83_003960 [Entophlyctis luteolus]
MPTPRPPAPLAAAAPAATSAAAAAGTADVIAQLCGFDPIDLLARVDFPNDRFERLLRVSKLARQLALHREDIPLPDLGITAESETAPGGFEVPIASSHQRDDNLLVSLLEPTTKFSLDVKEGIKVEHIGSQDRNEEAIAEAKARDAEVLKEQLARSAAAITIQSFMRGFLVRRRVVDVVYAALTTKSHDTDAEKVTKELPSVVDLNVQVRTVTESKMFKTADFFAGKVNRKVWQILQIF